MIVMIGLRTFVRMRRALVTVVLALTALPACAAPVRVTDDGIEVRLTTDPPVIALGRSTVMLDIRDSGKPLEGAEVRVLVRMPNMDMGEREETARPVPEQPGAYRAPAVFAMAGAYVADITIVRDGAERKLKLKLATGMDTSQTAGGSGLLTAALIAGALVLVLYTAYRMRRTRQTASVRALARPRTWGSLLTVALAIVVSAYAVKNWRRPGAMTPIEAQAMEMATPPPPGAARVAVVPVDHGTVERTITYVGQVAGWVEQDVYTRVSGWIAEMPVYVGTRVRTGELLARLDTSEIRPIIMERSAGARLAREAEGVARAEETQARAALTKARSEARAQAIAVHAAESEVRAAEAGLADARTGLASARLLVGETRAVVEAAEEEHRYAAAELRRMQSLRERGAVSEQEFERARADASSARSNLDQARLRVSQAESAVRGSEARVGAAEAAVETARRRADEARERLNALKAEAGAADAAVAAATGKRRMSRSEVVRSDAMLRASRTSEGYAEIRATADGVVTRRLVAPGVLASPDRPILRIAQTSPVRLQANVSEADLTQIRIGARIEAWRLGDPGRRAIARVTSISPQVDPATRTATVEALWNNDEPSFAIGEAITMRITAASVRHALRVPTRAVHELAGGGSEIEGRSVTSYVWLAHADGPGSVARRVPFKAGIKGDKHVAVLSGLKESDLVIVEGGDSLRDGDEIVYDGPRPPSEGAHIEQTAYICTMCPEVRSDKPGRCPKCGMALVREGSRR